MQEIACLDADLDQAVQYLQGAAAPHSPALNYPHIFQHGQSTHTNEFCSSLTILLSTERHKGHREITLKDIYNHKEHCAQESK